MVLQLYDDFKNNFNNLPPPYHDGQALKELPDKIRKVLEVDAKVLKVAQVNLIFAFVTLLMMIVVVMTPRFSRWLTLIFCI